MTTILITGFGPFPGAPFNPTGPLVRRLARLRRPGVSNLRLVGHVFTTSYAAVDRELPLLIAAHKPEVLLMFGLAMRAKRLRVELRARNALALLPDAGGATKRHRAINIAPGAPPSLRLPMPAAHLLAAARQARVPAAPSRDAGRYLCNYLCWLAAEAARMPGGPRLAAFIHVPAVRRAPEPIGRVKHRSTADALFRAGSGILLALAAAARR